MSDADRAPAAASVAARLAFEEIRHSFAGGAQTLDGISLAAEPGEVLCLLGPSGSGKTTLLRIAAGIESQTSGRVLLNDREIAGPSVFLPPEKRSIGLVFQDFALFPHLTILQNVRFGLTALSGREGEKEARIALERVGLGRYAESYPHVLSGGEQQRAALARALAPRPAVLLMDEPFSGLDSRLRDSVRAETLDILRRSRATAIVVTHDAEEAMRMGDRIALLRKGKLVQTGPARDLFDRPENLFVAGFFSELNVFHCKASDGSAETPLGRVAAPGHANGTPLSVAVRLTGIDLDPREGLTEGRVVSRRFLGETEIVEVAVGGADTPVRVRTQRGALPDRIRDIWLTVRLSDTLVFERSAENA